MERNEHLTYWRLMSHLEKGFSIKELAETAQARFQQATQALGESLEDWADRIPSWQLRHLRGCQGIILVSRQL